MSPKAGDKTYFQQIGADGVAHSLGKPFTEAERGQLLAQIAAIMTVLPDPPAKVLDLGCGTGWTTCWFAQSGYESVGQDLAEDAIEHAKRFAQDRGIKNISFAAGDFESMPFEGEFDAAVFFDSLHHAEDEVAALKAVHRALKPGGVCVTSEPGAGHAADPHTQQAAKDYGVTERDMPPRKIRAAAKQAGFRSAEFFADPALVNRALYRIPATPSKRRLLRLPVVGTLLRGVTLLNLLTLKRPRWGLVVLTK